MRKKHILFTLMVSMIFLGSLMQSSFVSSPIVDHELPFGSTVREKTAENVQDNDPMTYTYANSTFKATTNAETYKPGDICEIEARGAYRDLNNSVEWALESPLTEEAFGFNTPYDGMFKDPNFNQESLIDWTNDGFDSATVNTTGSFMNLSLAAGSPTATIFTSLDLPLDGKFELSFTYNTTNVADDTLKLFYYNNPWENVTLSPSTTESFSDGTYTINLAGGEPGTNKTLYFSLEAPTSGSAVVLLDDFQVNYVEESIPIVANTKTTGYKDQYWYHDGLQTLINVSYSSYEQELETASVNLTFVLPQDKIYLGDWKFKFVIFGIDADDNPLTAQTYEFKIPIKDEVRFEREKTLVQRGYNTTTEEPLYEEESLNQTFSPTDRIIMIGQLFYESSIYNINASVYSQIQGQVDCSFSNEEFDINWGIDDGYSELIPANNEAETLLDGNLSSISLSKNQVNYFMVYLEIPARGIFGTVEESLKVTFVSENSIVIDGKTINKPFSKSIEFPDLDVRYRITIIKETLPTTPVYYLLDTIEGQFTIKTELYNESLTNLYDEETREFDSAIDIALNDFHYEIQLYSQTNKKNTGIKFAYEQFESTKTIRWKYTLDPDLDVSQNYTLRIRWNDAAQAGDDNLALLNHITGAKDFNLKIVGVYKAILPQQVFKVYQYDKVSLNFSVLLEGSEFDRETTGVTLYAYLDNDTESAKLPIGVKGNHYYLDYVPDATVDPGYHTLDVYTKNGNYLGHVFLEVQPYQTQSRDIEYTVPIIFELLGIAAVVIVLVAFLSGVAVILSKNE